MPTITKIEYCAECDSPLQSGKQCKNCIGKTAKKHQKLCVCAMKDCTETGPESVFFKISNAPEKYYCSKHDAMFRPKRFSDEVLNENMKKIRKEAENAGVGIGEYCRNILKNKKLPGYMQNLKNNLV